MRAILRSFGVVPSAILIAALALPSPAAASPVPDHLKCYKAKDNIPKAVYTADLNGLAPETGCMIKVPAVMLCVQASKTNVTPTPPSGGPYRPPPRVS